MPRGLRALVLHLSIAEMEVSVKRTGDIRIGISGWRYRGWRGVFYPEKLPQRRELEFAAEQFRSVELNGSFYSLQRPSSFRRWADATPADFVFAVKGPRFITHMLKLRNVEQPLANFFASGILELGPKLGPFLWQFAPQMRFDADRFASFFNLLPRTHGEMARMALSHHPRFVGRVTLERSRKVPARTPLRHCVEIRHESFATPEFIKLLREHNIGLVVADTVEWPLLFDVTADFVYCRLHGSEQLYTSGYEDVALDIWADRVAAWATGCRADGKCASTRLAKLQPRDVFVYFDNDAKVRAPFDAQSLIEKVQQRLAIKLT
jgi:uncharacterized protein YecE (DUF72 family)